MRKETPSSDCVSLTRTKNPHTGWDTAGTESFRSITRSYYRGAAGCLLVYDVSSRLSTSFIHVSPLSFPVRRKQNNNPIAKQTYLGFEHARTWLADVRNHADPHLTCILVGNKSDLPLERRQVPTEEGERWAQEEGLLFAEASAKSGTNVDAAFEAAARDILVKIRRGVFDDDRVRLSLYISSSSFFRFRPLTHQYADNRITSPLV